MTVLALSMRAYGDVPKSLNATTSSCAARIYVKCFQSWDLLVSDSLARLVSLHTWQVVRVTGPCFFSHSSTK